jgi:hypothetical protein
MKRSRSRRQSSKDPVIVVRRKFVIFRFSGGADETPVSHRGQLVVPKSLEPPPNPTPTARLRRLKTRLAEGNRDELLFAMRIPAQISLSMAFATTFRSFAIFAIREAPTF